MQASAWDHATPWVQDHVTLMAAMSYYRQGLMEILTRFPISLADAIVLVHRLGLTNAVQIVLAVDPWCYPGEETPATVGARRVLQSAVDKANGAGTNYKHFTAESISAYLLSPLLLPKGKRPSLVRAGLKRAASDATLGGAADDASPASAAAADDPSAAGGGSSADKTPWCVSKQAARTVAGRPALRAVRSPIKSRKRWSLGFINGTGFVESIGSGFIVEIVNPRLNQKVGVRKVTLAGVWGSAGSSRENDESGGVWVR